MSSLSRRTLLKAATAGGAVAGIGGFSALSQMFAPLMAGADEGLAAFQPPAAKDIDNASHVLNRLTFGPRPGQHAEVTALGAREFIAAQLDPAAIDDRWIEARAARFEALRAWPLGELLEYDARELLDQLTRKKILHAVHSKRQLHEVMVDFWSDHFNIDPSKGDSKWLKPADDREVIRGHALGSFPAMLKASALSPSMLWYLDGRVNRSAGESERPNENYGRELLELHSLGVDGGYTQQDVMEVARCLTGWTVRERAKSGYAVGKVEFRKDLHDDGPKTVLGIAIPAGLGAGDLDRVIEIVAHHPSTARYLAEKLCRRFIADDPPAAAVSAVAAAFQKSGGEIRRALRHPRVLVLPRRQDQAPLPLRCLRPARHLRPQQCRPGLAKPPAPPRPRALPVSHARRLPGGSPALDGHPALALEIRPRPRQPRDRRHLLPRRKTRPRRRWRTSPRRPSVRPRAVAGRNGRRHRIRGAARPAARQPGLPNLLTDRSP